MLVKVCGMREPDNIRAVESAGADIMGFIFHPASPRFVPALPAYMPVRCRRAGVFVSGSEADILPTAERFSLDIIQLHGTGSPELCHALRRRGYSVIRAMGIASAGDLRQYGEFHDACDFLLFDTACAQHGGSGRTFDWNILSAYNAGTPFFLSGGIRPDSVSDIKALRHPLLAGVDINSGFEISPAIKNPETVRQFINEIKQKQKI